MPDFNMMNSGFGAAGGSDLAPSSYGMYGGGGLTLNQATSAAQGYKSEGYGDGIVGAASDVAGDILASPVDLVDTVASSVPFVSKALGIQRGDFNHAVLNAIDSPGLSDWYEQHKGGISVASGVLGVIAADMATGGLAAATPLVGVLTKASWAKKALALDETYKTALATVNVADASLAAQGLKGTALWSSVAGDAAIGTNLAEASGISNAVGAFTAKAAQTPIWKLGAKAAGLGAAKGVVRAGATEAVMATTLNQNDFLYSADMGSNIANAALGLGIGGAIGSGMARYAMRKFVNTDAMRRVIAGALDPTGMQNALLTGPSSVVPERLAQKGMTQAGYDKLVKSTYFGSGVGTITDAATAEMMAARAGDFGNADAATGRRLANQYEGNALQTVNQASTKGLPAIPGTGFSTNPDVSPGHAHAIRQLIHNDAGALNGVEGIAGLGDDMSFAGLHEEFTYRVEQQWNDANAKLSDPEWLDQAKPSQIALQKKLIRDAEWKRTWTPQPVVDGEVTTMDHGAAYDNWQSPEIRVKNQDDGQIWQAFDKRTGKTRGVGLDSTGALYLPKGKTLNTLGYQDSLDLWRAANQSISGLINDPQAVYRLPAKPNWLHLDMAGELARRNPNATIMWPAGMTAQTAQVESLAQKFDAFSAKIKANNLAVTRGTGEPLNGQSLAKLRVQFNLPRLTAAEAGLLSNNETPVDVLFRGLMSQGKTGADIRNMSLNDLSQGFQSMRDIGGVTQRQGTHGDTLTGNSMNFMLDYSGNEMKPMLMYRRNMMAQDWMPDNLADRIAINKAQLMKNISKVNNPAVGPTLNNVIGQHLMDSPDSQLVAAGGAALSDRQIMSSLPGVGDVAPQTPLGRLTQGITTQEQRWRDSPIGLATNRQRETVDRLTQAYTKQKFEQAFGDQLVTIQSPRNVTSNFMLNNYMSNRGGWDLKPNMIERQLADGSRGWAFELDDTGKNARMYKQVYGKDFDPDAGLVLQDTKGKDILLDDTAKGFKDSYNTLTEHQRIMQNELLQAQGLPTITRTEHYVPTPNLEGDIIGHTFDAMNNTVPGGTIRAKTQTDFDRLLNNMKSDPNAPINRDGHQFYTQAETRQFISALDLARSEMQTPGKLWTKGGKVNEGKLLTPNVDMGALTDALQTTRNEFMQHGRNIMESVYNDQLKAARARSVISSSESEGAGIKGMFNRDGGKNVYDYYEESLMGRSPLDSSKSWVGQANKLIESGVDPLVRVAGGAYSRAQGVAQKMFARVNPWNKTDAEHDLFNKIAGVLGENSPFQSAAELMEAKNMGQRPASLKSFGAASSRFESTWLLRIAEPVQAFMNMSGVVNAAPAIIRHMTPSAEEIANPELFANRIGHVADIFTTPNGQPAATVNMAKLTWRAFQDTWHGIRGGTDADWLRKAGKGMVSMEQAEFQKAFRATSLGDQQGAIGKFWNGDPESKSKLGRLGAEGWLSWLSDKSEDFSRGWAHQIGDHLGRELGIQNVDALDNFAHDFANKTIANYNPLNRAPIFQGAVGTPIGLFQGFIWAYYQRMFRYLETGDMRALATQYATQAASYGLKTVPGFDQVNKWWFEHSDGKSDPYDNMVKGLGQPAADLVMGGVWGNLPRLLGGKAVDFSSRGNTSMGIPVATLPASIQTIGKIKDGVAQALGLFGQNNPHMSASQIGEILSNTIPNRPLAGLVEAMAGGNDTDPSGQLITRNMDHFDTVSRVLGIRTAQQQADVEAFYMNKQNNEIQAQKKEDLNAHARQLIRSGNPDKLQGVFEQYMANGGDPRYYKRWVKTTMDSALKTRSERQLTDALHNPANQAMVDRLLGAGVSINAEANIPDPATAMATRDSMENDQPTNAMTDDAALMYGPN